MTHRTPTQGRAAFWGHGSPMNVTAANEFTRALSGWGLTLSRPEVIIVVSAHWQTRGTWISCQARPKQIYDFYGFPDELYAVKYACAGSPAWAKRLAETLAPFSARCADDWGVDHGAWSLLVHAFPEASVPVVQVSLDMTLPPEHHYRVGRALAPLLKEKILILGSGNIVHNLGLIEWEEAAPVAEWARAMDAEIAGLLARGDHAALTAYPSQGAQGRRGIPTLDHYLPMLTILGLQTEPGPVKTLFEGFQNASLSMRAFELT